MVADELYVNRRGTGLGSQLMTRVIQEARTAGAMVIFLETEAHNDGARRFYQRHGFTADDSVWMSRTLEGTYRSND